MGDSYLGFLVENLWDTRTKFEKLNYGAIWVVFVINVVMGEWLSQYALLIAIVSGLVWGVFAFAVHFARKSVTTASIPGAPLLVRTLTLTLTVTLTLI